MQELWTIGHIRSALASELRANRRAQRRFRHEGRTLAGHGDPSFEGECHAIQTYILELGHVDGPFARERPAPMVAVMAEAGDKWLYGHGQGGY